MNHTAGRLPAAATETTTAIPAITAIPAADANELGRACSSLLAALGVAEAAWREGGLPVSSPINGGIVALAQESTALDVGAAIAQAADAFATWRLVPAPIRGDLVRRFGAALRRHKQELALLVTIETGKILSEAAGEVQEAIDICDFAVGLSRQLHGATMASERAAHRMMETWHPLGVCGVITAFNFPLAVWAWNAAIALVAGNTLVWKPSEKTPLTALAAQALLQACMAEDAHVPAGLSQLLIGPAAIGEMLAADRRVALVSATGSTAMGRALAPRLAARFARMILELGGNNGAIVAPSADLDLSLRAITFAAAGTAGQRCTSLRRLFLHETIYDTCLARLRAAYDSLRIGNPLDPQTLVGPLIDQPAYERMQQALAQARAHGGLVRGGERCRPDLGAAAFYVRPALVEMPQQSGPMLEETFAPILYVMRYADLDAAIAWHNQVDAGLASAIFTLDLREAERFLSAAGSDCGIVNVNIGPSGAEIGGAFGGEKDSGGGREAGSDAWKAYMRRATNTINYGRALPLAQGVRFDF
ncbi:MAG TPA: aldehyde dehydrogenase family protein [Ferrovibrio sp.]|uniref:L-piperidine-6-carboxylate dehydrogenase n=1 Tax=Ferrovibrio sp. TaxID=1917215 RepID=UPI002ECFD89C